MSLLNEILLVPLAPVRGVTWLGARIAEQAEAQLDAGSDPGRALRAEARWQGGCPGEYAGRGGALPTGGPSPFPERPTPRGEPAGESDGRRSGRARPEGRRRPAQRNTTGQLDGRAMSATARGRPRSSRDAVARRWSSSRAARRLARRVSPEPGRRLAGPSSRRAGGSGHHSYLAATTSMAATADGRYGGPPYKPARSRGGDGGLSIQPAPPGSGVPGARPANLAT